MNCKRENCKNNVLWDGLCSRHLKQTCMICFNRVPSTNSASAKRLSCGHSFHFRCIIHWFEVSEDCPICRKKQGHDDLLIFRNNIEENMRRKYRETIKSYEREIRRLTRENP